MVLTTRLYAKSRRRPTRRRPLSWLAKVSGRCRRSRLVRVRCLLICVVPAVKKLRIQEKGPSILQSMTLLDSKNGRWKSCVCFKMVDTNFQHKSYVTCISVTNLYSLWVLHFTSSLQVRPRSAVGSPKLYLLDSSRTRCPIGTPHPGSAARQWHRSQ